MWSKLKLFSVTCADTKKEKLIQKSVLATDKCEAKRLVVTDNKKYLGKDWEPLYIYCVELNNNESKVLSC